MTFPSQEVGKTREQLTLLMNPVARKQADSADEYSEKCGRLMDFVTNINDEDVVAIENLQLGLQNASVQGLHGEFLPKYDWPVHRFQNMVINGIQGNLLDNTITPTLDDQFDKSVLASASE